MEHLIEWMTGLATLVLGTSFTVVWRVSRFADRLTALKERVNDLDRRLDQHIQLRAHAGAMADMEAMQRAHDELRQRHVDDMHALENRLGLPRYKDIP